MFLPVNKQFVRTPLFLALITLFSCKHQPKNNENANKAGTDTTSQVITTKKADNSKYYTTKDTLLIIVEAGDTIKYGKDEFNQIVDAHPELTGDYPDDPDQAYYGNGNYGAFGSEAGQDTYYILYAYFLKQKNGVEKHTERRKKLVDIFSSINELFANFEHGGTFFGHQSLRIQGYAEYSVYLYELNKDHMYKTYDIAKQKAAYITSLRQLVNDEISIDQDTRGDEKLKREKGLNKIVDRIDKLITDNYYLRRSQAFQYGHYEYY